MFNMGLAEILIITFIIILFFGGKKIPELVKGMGEAVREFKRAAADKDKDNGKRKDSQ